MFFAILGSAILGGIIGGAAGAAIGAIVDWFIDEDSLRNCVSDEYENAFKILIKEKKSQAIDVGIFTDKNELLDEGEIRSESGVSSSLYKGQVIYV